MHDASQEPPRVAIYARYSSKLQKPTSIEDQIRLCRAAATHLGGTVVRVHADRITTAATRHFRSGLDALLHDAEHGHIDLIFAEALDRISRDQEGMAGIYKRLNYWDVRLYTLDHGEIGPMHICFGSLMNQAWLDNLAAKTKRGQIGALHKGRVPCGLCYGYRMANRIDDRGQPIRGLREIDPDQARIVRLIHRLYADGMSSARIAAKLNHQGTPGPRGGPWGKTTINGNRSRHDGILNNELYRGRLIYGRRRYIRNPDTGKRQARLVPPAEWIVNELPELRIIPDDLWNAVHARRRAGQDRRITPAPHTQLPLTGILRCGICEGPMTVVNNRRYACRAHREYGTCDNPRGIQATRIENELCSLIALHTASRTDLPDLMHAASERSDQRRQQITADILDKDDRIRRLIHSIETGSQSKASNRRIIELEHEAASLRIDLQTLPEIPSVTPDDVASRIHERLAVLKRAITARPGSHDTRHRALLASARLVERIDISPLPGRGQVDISIHPHTDALFALALDDKWKFEPAASGHTS